MARKFRLAEDTGDTVSSPISLVESLSRTPFTAAMVGGVLTVLVLPLWVGPGLAWLLQLLTVPFSTCFSQILFIWFLPGTLVVGNFSWKCLSILGLKSLVPFNLWYSKARKFLSALMNWAHGGMMKQWDLCSDFCRLAWLVTCNSSFLLAFLNLKNWKSNHLLF